MTDDLRQAYELTFSSEAGKQVLDDLIERFDPVNDRVPPNGEAALWTAAVRRVMAHFRDMLGDDYAAAMARVDGRARHAERERPERVDRDPERGRIEVRLD